jgi:hypothetical protein
MRVPISSSLAAVTVAKAVALTAATLTFAVTLTACASATTPQAASGPSPSPGDPTPAAAAIRPSASPLMATLPGSAVTRLASAVPPPSGTRTEAAALARQLLARLILPPGARRLPQTPLPRSLTGLGFAGSAATPSLDQYRLFALGQPMNAAAAFLAAHVPPGLAEGGTGSESGPGGALQDVTFVDQRLPAGIASVQVVLSVVPAAASFSGGGSVLRADAQVIWYPPRTAAEYIDPARYHAVTITVSIWGRHPHTVHQVVTSRAFIARLAGALDRMRAEPLESIACPAIFAEYRLAFSVSPGTRPVVVVSANQPGCGGAGITVNGRQQPPLADPGTVAALADSVVKVTWQLLQTT